MRNFTCLPKTRSIGNGIFFTEKDSSQLQFLEVSLTEKDILATQDNIQKRVLKFLGRKGKFNKEKIEKMLNYRTSGFSLDASVKINSWDRTGLERLIRYCARPCFASENLRINGPWITYRLPKPTHKGKRFIQLDPLEFLDRIAAFIPFPYKHRRHYHGVFAPNAPLRKIVAACTKNHLESVSSIQVAAQKINRVSLDWAQLIKRIYEIDPLVCSKCGKKIKIIRFVTHQAEINRILAGIGWTVTFHDFDPVYQLLNLEFCQLIFDSVDGFPAIENQEVRYNA